MDLNFHCLNMPLTEMISITVKSMHYNLHLSGFKVNVLLSHYANLKNRFYALCDGPAQTDRHVGQREFV